MHSTAIIRYPAILLAGMFAWQQLNAQALVPTQVDTSNLATKADVQAAQAAAAAAQASALGAVKKVANATPDTSGNVTLPTTFAGITMTDSTFTGGFTINGSAPVLKVNGASPVAGNVTVPVPDITGLATTASVATATAGLVSSVNGISPTGGSVLLPISSVANVSGLVYFHRYSAVTLNVPAIGIGGTGTGTATVSGTAVGDQCFVAPVAGTTALSYIMGSGWVSVAGTVKVALAAPSVLAITTGTLSVNMLCAQ